MPASYIFLSLRLVPLLSLSLIISLSLQAQQNTGFGYYIPDRSTPCLSKEQHLAIEKEIKKNQDSLRAIGILPEFQDRAFTTVLEWPLEQNNGLNDFGYHGISNFVDQNPDYPNMVLDYNCGNRTYDIEGYNHSGTDMFLWPFAWYKMEQDQVKVVAAAPGIIVYKSDGNFDMNCSFNSMDWNSVDVQHADGSIAWYGHMKNGSLTNKSVGESVETGEYLGIVGSSGSSTAPHLHFEIYAAGNFLIDPYAGNCNSLNTESWWIDQRPYYDSGLNALRTHSAPPVFPACPQIETLNEKNQFCIGDVIYYAAYYRDQLEGQQVGYKVLRPDNSIYLDWDQTFDVFYPASWWYWYYTLPANAPTGVWTFQVTFQEEEFEKYFDVNGSTHIASMGNTTFCEGESVILTAPASQYGFSYQWKKNGVDIPGATEEMFEVTESGNYTCAVSSEGCSTNSNIIAVTVFDVPQATIDPPGPISFCDGTTETLCASNGVDYFWFNGISQQCIGVDDSGDVSVTVTDENGCTSIASVTVIVFPNPVVDLGDDIIFLTGADTVLDAEGPDLTYLWSTGETTSSITVSEDGLYWVEVTDSNGCTAYDEVEIVGSSATIDVNRLDGITLYPNPPGDYVDVLVNDQFRIKPLRICLYNLQGHLLSTHIFSEQEENRRIDLSDLSNQVYFLSVSSDREFYLVKIMKAR